MSSAGTKDFSAITRDCAAWPWAEDLRPVRPIATDGAGWPRISIVTPSYQQGDFIEETIRSIVLQGYPNLEYIIMDGGSSDNTVEIIRRYSDRITHWESEKDRGQSHAINKGIARCTGQIFNWINSDDLLMPGALWAVAEAWMRQPGAIVSGNLEFFDRSGPSGCSKACGQTLQNFVRFWERREFGWGQPSTFLPLETVRAVGGIHEHLKYCMDYELMVRLLARGTPVTYLDKTLARFRLHDTSKTVGSKEAFRLERVPALQSLGELPIKVDPWEWQWQQASRLVDVARHAWRHGGHGRALQLLGRALATSPRGALSEISSRLMRRNTPRSQSPAEHLSVG
jgi:glycosyltransferase involved in cell wall biosynthesis